MAKKTNLQQNTEALEKNAAAQREGNIANFALAANMGAVAAAEQAKADAMEERNEIEAERVKNEIEARKDLKEHNKRIANVETMKAVRTDTEGGVQRYDQVQKDELDRQNQQELLDLLGDCIATIETDGKPNDKFDLPAYSGEDVDLDGLRRIAEKTGGGFFDTSREKYEKALKSKNAKGLTHAYRYHNLGAAIAKLIDLREELQRIRVWDMNVSRESIEDKIARYLKEGKDLQKKAAIKTVSTWKKEEEEIFAARNKSLKIRYGLIAGGFIFGVISIAIQNPIPLMIGMGTSVVGLGIFILDFLEILENKKAKFCNAERLERIEHKKWWKPIGWEDMLELYQEGKD